MGILAMTEPIHSERLVLVPMTPPFLRASMVRNLAEAERELGMTLPEEWPDGAADVLSLRLKQIEEDPTVQPWLLRAIALRDIPVMIGHIGFHETPRLEPPHPLCPGAGEFGYTIFPLYRRRGYAREASLALMQWARESMGLTRFILSISLDNTASLALAAQLGFVRIGSQMDEVDGPEDVLEYRGKPLSLTETP
jgi:RimJ/RimL family protein N-acetyltransferase